MNIAVPNWYDLKSQGWQLWQDLRPVFSERVLKQLAWVALVVVAAICALDIVAGLAKSKGLISDSAAYALRVSNDGSIGEIAGHVAIQLSAFLVAYVALQLRSTMHWVLAVVLQFMVADDVLEFHERGGAWLGEHLFAGQRLVEPHVLGELSIGLALGFASLAMIVWAFRSSTCWQILLCSLVILPMALIGFFGVGIDFVHALLPQDNKMLSGLAALLEDGGELASMSLVMLGAVAGFLAYDKASETVAVQQRVSQNPVTGQDVVMR